MTIKKIPSQNKASGISQEKHSQAVEAMMKEISQGTSLDFELLETLRSMRNFCLSKHTRISNMDTVFKAVTLIFAMRSTCNEGIHGAILVKDGRIISSGYNGSVTGDPHCLDVGCQYEKASSDLINKDSRFTGKCQRTIHGERNALYFAAKRGISTEGSTCYVTKIPCIHCARALIQAGIKKVIFIEESRSSSASFELLKKHGLV